LFICTLSHYRASTTMQELISWNRRELKLKFSRQSTLQPQVMLDKYKLVQK